jgi:hypothetical protein
MADSIPDYMNKLIHEAKKQISPDNLRPDIHKDLREMSNETPQEQIYRGYARY